MVKICPLFEWRLGKWSTLCLSKVDNVAADKMGKHFFRVGDNLLFPIFGDYKMIKTSGTPTFGDVSNFCIHLTDVFHSAKLFYILCFGGISHMGCSGKSFFEVTITKLFRLQFHLLKILLGLAEILLCLFNGRWRNHLRKMKFIPGRLETDFIFILRKP